jgi:hypothetical protein
MECVGQQHIGRGFAEDADGDTLTTAQQLPESAVSGRKVRIPAAVFLAGIPVLAYLYAFAYELGVAEWYGFPISQISLNNVVVDSDLLLVVGVVLVGIFAYGLIPAVFEGLVTLFVFGVTIALFVVAMPVGRALRWITGLALALLIFVLVAEVIMIVRLMRTRQPRQSVYDLRGTTQGIEPRFARKYGLDPMASGWVVTTSALAMLLMVSATVYGAYSASVQTDFLIRSGVPDLIVLRAYHDRIVCATFDRKKQVIYRSFVIVPPNTENARLTLQHMGPMKVIDSP